LTTAAADWLALFALIYWLVASHLNRILGIYVDVGDIGAGTGAGVGSGAGTGASAGALVEVVYRH
jgi:hypothetical protein